MRQAVKGYLNSVFISWVGRAVVMVSGHVRWESFGRARKGLKALSETARRDGSLHRLDCHYGAVFERRRALEHHYPAFDFACVFHSLCTVARLGEIEKNFPGRWAVGRPIARAPQLIRMTFLCAGAPVPALTR